MKQLYLTILILVLSTQIICSQNNTTVFHIDKMFYYFNLKDSTFKNLSQECFIYDMNHNLKKDSFLLKKTYKYNFKIDNLSREFSFTYNNFSYTIFYKKTTKQNINFLNSYDSKAFKQNLIIMRANNAGSEQYERAKDNNKLINERKEIKTTTFYTKHIISNYNSIFKENGSIAIIYKDSIITCKLRNDSLIYQNTFPKDSTEKNLQFNFKDSLYFYFNDTGIYYKKYGKESNLIVPKDGITSFAINPDIKKGYLITSTDSIFKFDFNKNIKPFICPIPPPFWNMKKLFFILIGVIIILVILIIVYKPIWFVSLCGYIRSYSLKILVKNKENKKTSAYFFNKYAVLIVSIITLLLIIIVFKCSFIQNIIAKTNSISVSIAIAIFLTGLTITLFILKSRKNKKFNTGLSIKNKKNLKIFLKKYDKDDIDMSNLDALIKILEEINECTTDGVIEALDFIKLIEKIKNKKQ